VPDDAFINFLDLFLQMGNEGLFNVMAGRSRLLEGGEHSVEKNGHLVQLRIRGIAMYDNDVVWTGGQVLVCENLCLSFFLSIFPFQDKDKRLTGQKATDFEVPVKICGLTAQ
jgi:hypothetical protein